MKKSKTTTLKLDQYQCQTCGRFFYINELDKSDLDLDFGCPYGCDNAGEFITKLNLEIKLNKKTTPKIERLYDPIDYHGKMFIVQAICKDDLKEYFTKKELEKITDDGMAIIAEKISSAITECDYWDIVAGACDHFKSYNLKK